MRTVAMRMHMSHTFQELHGAVDDCRSVWRKWAANYAQIENLSCLQTPQAVSIQMHQRDLYLTNSALHTHRTQCISGNTGTASYPKAGMHMRKCIGQACLEGVDWA